MIGQLTVKLKIVGIGGKRRLMILAFIAKIFNIKLDIQEDK